MALREKKTQQKDIETDNLALSCLENRQNTNKTYLLFSIIFRAEFV